MLPWAVAGVAAIFAVASRISSTQPLQLPVVQPQAANSVEPAQARALTEENQALRRELDRLRSNAAPQKAPELDLDPAPSEVAAPAEVEDTQTASTESSPESCDQIAEQVAMESELEFAQSGAQSETAAESEEEVSEYRSNVVALIAGRLQDEPDPNLRSQLVVAASTLAMPDAAPLFAAGFVGALQSDNTPEARSAAARGLRFATGRVVEDALAAGALDQDEGTRLDAIGSLASRPESRSIVEDLLRNESSEAVRAAGECRLRLQHS